MITNHRGRPVIGAPLIKPISQRTPGPWVFVRGHNCFLVYSTSDRRQLICSTDNNGSNDQENARLIAAAPALLDAAKAILATKHIAQAEEAIRALVEAVKLAEGGLS